MVPPFFIVLLLPYYRLTLYDDLTPLLKFINLLFYYSSQSMTINPCINFQINYLYNFFINKYLFDYITKKEDCQINNKTFCYFINILFSTLDLKIIVSLSSIIFFSSYSDISIFLILCSFKYTLFL